MSQEYSETSVLPQLGGFHKLYSNAQNCNIFLFLPSTTFCYEITTRIKFYFTTQMLSSSQNLLVLTASVFYLDTHERLPFPPVSLLRVTLKKSASFLNLEIRKLDLILNLIIIFILNPPGF